MESLLPLLLIFVFIALRLFGSRKAAPPAEGAESLPGTGPERADVDMDEALRQIREALGMPVPEPRPVPPPPAPPPLPAPIQHVPAPSRPAESLPAPVRRPPMAAPRPLLPQRPAPAASPPAPLISVDRKAEPPSPQPSHPVAALLKSSRDAQRAFLMGEILGPPRARRPRRV